MTPLGLGVDQPCPGKESLDPGRRCSPSPRDRVAGGFIYLDTVLQAHSTHDWLSDLTTAEAKTLHFTCCTSDNTTIF